MAYNLVFPKEHYPVCLKEYYIYDIFHNDDNQLIIVSPFEKLYKFKIYDEKNNIVELNTEICLNKRTYLHYCHMENYMPTIKLIIEENEIEVSVNKYPTYENEIVMSTMVYNEDNYIVQWIKYHILLGISRFIIYDNSKAYDGVSYHSIEKKSNLKTLLVEYIENGTVCLISWPYFKRLRNSGISGQTTQQTHSINAFKTCKYIGLFDIDEYVNPQKSFIKINDLFDEIIKENNIKINDIGGFCILAKLFYNPSDKPTDGYNFLKIYDCNDVTKTVRNKNFVIPKNIKIFNIHNVSIGKKLFIIDEKLLYFNHYFFLNKQNRGKNITRNIDMTIDKITATFCI